MDECQRKFNRMLQQGSCTIAEVMDLIFATRRAMNKCNQSQKGMAMQTASQRHPMGPLLCTGAWNCPLEPDEVTECIHISSQCDKYGIIRYFEEFTSDVLLPDVSTQNRMICTDYRKCIWSTEEDEQVAKLRGLHEENLKLCFEQFSEEQKAAWMYIQYEKDIDEPMTPCRTFASDEDWQKAYPDIEW